MNVHFTKDQAYCKSLLVRFGLTQISQPQPGYNQSLTLVPVDDRLTILVLNAGGHYTAFAVTNATPDEVTALAKSIVRQCNPTRIAPPREMCASETIQNN